MRTATTVAHPNVALVKYWGKRDLERNIPATPSLSIALGALNTRTTVTEAKRDSFELNNEHVVDEKLNRWLARVRVDYDVPPLAISSVSNFPPNSGLASSASGFAAAASAINAACALDWNADELATYARLGSASATRSITGAWSALKPTRSGCEALALADADYWQLGVAVTITSRAKKSVSSSVGMAQSATSPYFESWTKTTEADFVRAEQARLQKDWSTLAEVTESSTRRMHALMLATEPPLIYWNEITLRCIKAVERLNEKGLMCTYSIDAGPQVKVLCRLEDLEQVALALEQVEGVITVMRSNIGGGTTLEA